MMEIDQCFAWKKENDRNNSPLLPKDIRGLIVGKSNCEKTTLILNLLLKPGWLDYDHLFVFGRSLHQREYVILKKGLESGLSKEQISNLFQNQGDINSPVEVIDEYIASGGEGKGGIKAEFYNDCKLIPDPSSLNEKDKNLMIFDDCLLEKQNKAQSYYTRRRHSNCDCFYISQNYFKLDRQTVRENSNFIILFPQCDKNLDHIHRDHCTQISNAQFKNFCNRVWEKKYNFVTIDLTRPFDNGKYRENFDRFFDPKTMSFTTQEAREYDEVIKKIRARNEAGRTAGIQRMEELEETYLPITKATEEQTKLIKEIGSTEIPPGMDSLDFYLNQYRGKLDPFFGVKEDQGHYFLGNKEIRVQDNNIFVGNQEFKGTTGLWALLMENTPNQDNISEQDVDNYKHLMDITNAMQYGLHASPNAHRTDKYKLILKKLFEEEGEGISFLPSDVNSLKKRLNILLAEFQAGNGATRNEIVAIVDNLVKRNKMKIDYANDINNYIQNVHH